MVKEARLLSASGFSVSVVYAPLSPWVDEYDKKLFAETPLIKWISIKNNLFNYSWFNKYARIRRKLNLYLSYYLPFLYKNISFGYILFAQEIWRRSRFLKASLYISHNLGTLPIAVKLARKFNAKAAFDAEDFHSGEEIGFPLYSKLAKRMEDKYIPQLNYLSAASPLIRQRYYELYNHVKAITINNVFSKKFINQNIISNSPRLKLFWFSQTIGQGRGLETIIKAINLLRNDNIELHLLGNCSEEYKSTLKSLINNSEYLFFISTVSPEKIFLIAREFQIGMASEVPESENRNLCLTNKIFTYLTAGNCIVASKTLAQCNFLEANPGIGVLYKYDDPEDLAEKLKTFYNDRNLLNDFRQNGISLAKTTLNWEMESNKLLSTINSLI